MPRTYPRADTDLIAAIRGGNISAFEEVVSRYQQVVCAVAFSACGSRALSEDVAQDTFVSAWKNIHMLQDTSKLKGWLCSIARNRARDALRKRRREVLSEDGDGESEDFATTQDGAPSPMENASSVEQEQQLWQALQQLPESYREPLVLFYREDQSINQVAQDLNLSVAAVKQRLSRGRAALRESLAQVSECLARTRPSKAFTLGVIATIAAQGGMAQAAATQALAPRAATQGTGKMAGLGSNLMALAGLVVLLTTATLSWMLYEYFPGDTRPTQPAIADVQSPSTPNTGRVLATPTRILATRRAATRVHVEGVVRDLFGQPVADASIIMSGEPTRVVSSDDSGAFRIDDIAAGSYTLQARTEEGGSLPHALHLAGDDAEVVLQIVTGATLGLTLVDGAGGPALPGIAVTLESGALELSGTTNDEGAVFFYGLTAPRLVAKIAAPGYASTELPLYLNGESGVNERRLALSRGIGLRGIVRNGRGMPVEGARVQLEGEYITSHRDETFSDHNGAWHFDTVARENSVLTATHDDFAWATTPLALRSATGDVQRDLVLQGGKSASGIVLNADGSPAAGAEVIGHPSNKSVVADEQGVFTLKGLESDELSVRARHQVYGSRSEALREDGQDSPGLRLVLEDQSLRGRVVDTDGMPVVGAQVRASQQESELLDQGGVLHVARDITNQRGEFTMGPLPADVGFDLMAVMPGVAPSYLRMEPLEPVVARSGQRDIELVLGQPGQLAGSVWGPDGPIDQFAITIGNYSDGLEMEASAPFSDTDSTFALSKVPAGTYSVGIAARGFEPHIVEGVVIRAGAITDLGRLRLRSAQALTGRVLDARGAPVAGARVIAGAALNADGEQFKLYQQGLEQGADPLAITDSSEVRVFTDSDGRFAIQDLHSRRGKLLIAAEAPGVGRSQPMDISKRQGDKVVLRLQGTGTITGTITAPMQHTVITAIPAHKRGSRSDLPLYISVDAAGDTFQIGNLTPGDYLLSAHDPMSTPPPNSEVRVHVEANREVRVQLEASRERLPAWTAETLTEYSLHVETLCQCTSASCRDDERAALEEIDGHHDVMSVALYNQMSKVEARLETCEVD